MEHGGEASRPTTVGSAEHGMASAVRGSEANHGSGTFDAHLGAAAARRFSFDAFFQPGAAAAASYHNNSAEFARHVRVAAARDEVPPVAAGFHFHGQPGPESWTQLGPVGVVLDGPHLPDGVVVPVQDYYGYYSALQPRQGAGRHVVLAALLSGVGGAVYNGDYAMQPRPDAGHGEASAGLLPVGIDVVYHNSAEFARHVRTDAGRREVPVAVFPREPGPGVAYPNIGDGVFWRQPGPVHMVRAAPQLPDAVVPVHDNYGYSALQPRLGAAGPGVVLADLLTGGVGAVYNGDYALVQPRRGAGHDEVLVDLLPDGAGHGEVLVELLPPGGDVAAYDDYGYYALQPRRIAGHGEVLVDLQLPDGVGVGAVFVNSGNFAQQTPPGNGRADGVASALRDSDLGAGYDGSEALADDLGAVYDSRGMVAKHLRLLLPFAGIGASSVAVNGLAAGPGSPAAAFHLFVLLLGGLLLVILHVLRA